MLFCKTITKTCLLNTLKILPPKYENFQTKIVILLYISAQSIGREYSLEPPRNGGSNEYSKSMFLSRNKKNIVIHCKPQFYYTKVGFKGVKLYRHVFVMHCHVIEPYSGALGMSPDCGPACFFFFVFFFFFLFFFLFCFFILNNCYLKFKTPIH